MGPVHLTHSPNGTPVDGDHRVCEAVEALPDADTMHAWVTRFALLADPTRIKVLWALLQGESSVACLAELAGASPTAVSQHLAKLRLAGLVTGRREGTFVYYSAANNHVRGLLAQALFHADHIDRDLPGAPDADADLAHHDRSRSRA